MERSEHYIAAVEEGELRLYAETRVGELAARLMAVPREAHLGDAVESPRHALRAPPRVVQVRPRRGRVAVRGQNGTLRDGAQSALRRLAEELDAFLTRRPSASWDFAGSPALYAALVEELTPANLRRLKRVLTKVPQSEYAIEPPAEFAPVDEGS